MARQLKWLKRAAGCGCLWIGLCQGGVVQAAPCVRGDCPTTAPCVPQARTFGYFETKWREWPGQPRPEEKFPQSVGHEVLPTPQGQEQVPLPKATPLPNKPPSTSEDSGTGNLLPFGPQPQGLGPDILPLPGGTTVPNSDLLKPQEKQKDAAPEKSALPPLGGPLGNPTAPLSPSAKEPTIEGGMPGLAPPEKLVPPLRPSVSTPLSATPIEKNLSPADAAKKPFAPATDKPTAPKTDGPKAMDRGAIDSGEPGGLSGPSHSRSSLQANWASSLHPDSTGSGDVRLTGADEEPAVPDTQAGLEGFCPVQLCEHERWVPGNPRYKARYHGQIFLFSGPEEQKRFLEAPRRYAPAFDGEDRVLAVEEASHVPGRAEFSAVYNKRVYLFSNAITLKQFREDPARYVKSRP